MISANATPQLGNPWSRHLRGHLLLFERRPWPAYTDSAGFRLLVVAGVLEILRLSAVRWLYPRVPLWMLLPLLLGIALVSVPAIAGVRLSQLGFRRWSEWTTTEKSYFLQVVIIAAVLLMIVLSAAPVRRGKRPSRPADAALKRQTVSIAAGRSRRSSRRRESHGRKFPRPDDGTFQEDGIRFRDRRGSLWGLCGSLSGRRGTSRNDLGSLLNDRGSFRDDTGSFRADLISFRSGHGTFRGAAGTFRGR
jgi:hypothetical protein